MGYLGRNINVDKTTKVRKLDSIAANFGGANTTFNLTTSSIAVTPATTRSITVAVNGVIQEPDTAYTVSGSTIIFTAAPAAGATFWGLTYLEGADTNYIGDTAPMGFFDAFWARVAANSIKLWDGTTLGTVAVGPLSATTGAFSGAITSNSSVSDSVGTMATIRASIPAASPMTLIGQVEGTDTTAAATNIATFAISGLTAKDSLHVILTVMSGGNVTYMPYLYSVTDSLALTGDLSTSVNYVGDAYVMSAVIDIALANVSGSKKVATKALVADPSNGTTSTVGGVLSKITTFTTAWTGSWTLALRTGVGGVAAGGTCSYRIAVYKVAGQ